MKCIDCILLGTPKRNVVTTDMVQDAVDDSQEAVTTVDGDALCVEHLNRRIAKSIGTTISNNTRR